MIKLENVSKTFQGKAVLDNVSLHLNRGDVIGLLGSSGSGKSTLLNLISQLMQPDSGQCTIAGKRIGFVFQEHRLLPWKSALENVKFALTALEEDALQVDAEAIALEALTAVGLKDAIYQYPGQLSGGMCQRVSIARALAIQPDILLLDEPFSALDRERKQHLLSDLKQMLLKHSSTTVIYVTHNPEELNGIVHKTYTIKNGQIKE
ncbi:ABC transporter ATP-binding protein [Vibrio sp. JC009]|uniref:ABC transporter ATP-binding protein n=1 Tax=Vibrio sp. JC009 TaxID=2912314 RepID=UPI0023AF37CD|nr:ABC transporter ATP-binding protein [Vibrio sp. JC009]WED23925.1 ABC transporter ATP-binding protein [Vibrio sp. JC009]